MNTNINPIKTKKYIVAYLDILGAEKRMIAKENESNDFLNILNSEYSHLVNMSSDVAIYKENKIQIKIFSDNIIVAAEFSDNDETNKERLRLIIDIVSFWQSMLLRHGLLLRGGIAIGDLYMRDIFIYGKALINAYKLESEIAIYPRIIASSRVAYLCGNDAIIKDFDGQWFVNFYYNVNGPGSYIDFQSWIKDVIAKNSKENKKVVQKIKWLVNFHNNRCDEKNTGEVGYLFNDSKISVLDYWE